MHYDSRGVGCSFVFPFLCLVANECVCLFVCCVSVSLMQCPSSSVNAFQVHLRDIAVRQQTVCCEHSAEQKPIQRKADNIAKEGLQGAWGAPGKVLALLCTLETANCLYPK